MRRIRTAVLGATGVVGQRLVELLSDHPWFELDGLMASDRSVGRAYCDVVRWLLPGEAPLSVSDSVILAADPASCDAPLLFSALDASVAGPVEASFREAGRVVVSNARSHRQDPDVPLVIPEVNGDHLALVADQRTQTGGAIVTNPNCSTIGLCLALEPLRQAFGIRSVQVTTLQAISGAGYPGVAAMDMVDNIVPEIPGEEEKLAREPRKIFGSRVDSRIEDSEIIVSPQCNRVAVRDGHLLSVSVALGRDAGEEEVQQAFRGFRSPLAHLQLPSAPLQPVVLADGPRPQPILDRDRSRGMAVTVGRLQPCPVLGWRFVALVHNTMRGAAGGSVLLGEQLAATGVV